MRSTLHAKTHMQPTMQQPDHFTVLCMFILDAPQQLGDRHISCGQPNVQSMGNCMFGYLKQEPTCEATMLDTGPQLI